MTNVLKVKLPELFTNAVGEAVGKGDISSVGTPLGSEVGLPVGKYDGEDDGSPVGDEVSVTEKGNAEGWLDG